MVAATRGVVDYLRGRFGPPPVTLSSRLREREGFSSIIGSSSALRRTIHLLERATLPLASVLMDGVVRTAVTGKKLADL